MPYEQVTENEDGWSDWIQPNHASYLMKCCDCGLVHELQFRVVADTPHDLVDTDDEIPGLVVFRASRRDDLKEKDMTIDDIARVCHEVNRAYCAGLGDHTQAPWEDAPEWQRVSAWMGVGLHLRGDFGPEASHISWMKQKLEEGWTYGPAKDPGKKEHPCLVPFDELPLEQQLKDHIFRAVVHALRPRATTAHTEIAEFVSNNESIKTMACAAQSDLKEKDMSEQSNNPLLRGEPPRFDPIEQEIQAKGLTAPRITPDGIEGSIAREYFFTAADGIARAEGLDFCDSEGTPAFGLLTFCVLVLRNGFAVTGESACASPENFDAELGRKIARQKAVEKSWPLMGYEPRTCLHFDRLAGEQKGGAA